MMTSEMRRSPPWTFVDLKVRNYTLYVIEQIKLKYFDILLGDHER